jgi:LuxR family transcriptional regulator
MAAGRQTVDTVSDLVSQLRARCDSGFALAIHIRYTRPSLLYRTYRQEWIERYSEKGYMLVDPVVRWGLTHAGGIDWADLATEDPEGVLADARAHGLLHGWTYSTGPATSRTISGLTRTSGPFSKAEKAELAAMVDAVHAATEGMDQFDDATMEALRLLG